MTFEMELREAFRAAAAATPVPDRWDAVVAAGRRGTRRTRVALVVAALVVVAAVVGVVAASRPGPRAVVVSAGAPRVAGVVTFPHGPTVHLAELARGRLAFVSGSRLYVADADGGARRLTKTGDASEFAWSGDGEWLAFRVRDAPGYEDYTTWITRPDGSGARALTGMSGTFAWSPSGHRLAIAGFCCDTGRRGGLFIVDPAGRTLRVASNGTRVLTVAWAPDGRTIAYTSGSISGLGPSTVWAVRVSGGDARSIADGQLAGWSPDGRTVLVVGTQSELVDVTNHARQELVDSTGFDASEATAWSAWSPRGNKVAIVADSGTGAFADVIVVCATDRGPCTRVAGPGEPMFGPAFSPDGARLVYVSDHRLWVQPVAGGPGRVLDDLGSDLLQGAGDGVRITRGTAPNVPVWLADGSVLYRHGAELRVIDPDGGAPRPIAAPVGFAEAGARRQGLPGGTPFAAWRLTTRR